MGHQGPKANILIVDDMPDNLKVLTGILRSEGHDPHPVPNGRLALEVALLNPPDLVLLDIRMPGMDGYEVCRRMKANPRLCNIPVLFLSAEHETAEKVEAFAVGGIDYITKPFHLEELRSRIEIHLKLRALQRELEDYSLRLEERVATQVKEIADAQIGTIFALVKLAERRDDDTGRHVERVQTLSRLLSDVLRQESPYREEIDNRFIEMIYLASALHDVGKVAVPDAVLLKPGKLTEEEFDIMKTHAETGAATLEGVQQRHPGNYFLGMGIEIARSHHERWDGAGYPRGLAGSAIPLSARIVGVADFYDALSSDRIYRPAFEHKDVMAMLHEGAGHHFDPHLIQSFSTHHEVFKKTHVSLYSQ